MLTEAKAYTIMEKHHVRKWKQVKKQKSHIQ